MFLSILCFCFLQGFNVALYVRHNYNVVFFQSDLDIFQQSSSIGRGAAPGFLVIKGRNSSRVYTSSFQLRVLRKRFPMRIIFTGAQLLKRCYECSPATWAVVLSVYQLLTSTHCKTIDKIKNCPVAPFCEFCYTHPHTRATTFRDFCSRFASSGAAISLDCDVMKNSWQSSEPRAISCFCCSVLQWKQPRQQDFWYCKPLRIHN